MKQASILLVALILAPVAWSQEATYSGPKEKLHIYLLVGQSNMSGRAKVEDEDREIPAKLFLLDGKGAWVRATHPFIQYTNVPNSADERVLKGRGKVGLNLGLAFARRMLEADATVAIGLVVNSQGGSAIESWKKGAKNPNYDKTLARLRPALGTGVIKGVLWHQGEANQKQGAQYLDPLAEVIGQFRRDLDDPRLPFVAGQLAPLKKGEEEIAAFNRALVQLPMRVMRSGVARTEGFSGDDIHFDSAETRKLGRRYAEAMLEVQGK